MKFSETSEARLATCDVRLQRILYRAIEIVDFTVLEGHRGELAQNAAVKAGTSKLRFPYGKHNSLPSRAVDIIPFLEVPGHYDWTDVVAFGRLMGVVQAIAFDEGVRLRFGLDWDGDFHTVGRDRDETFLDAPHVELVEDLGTVV